MNNSASLSLERYRAQRLWPATPSSMPILWKGSNLTKDIFIVRRLIDCAAANSAALPTLSETLKAPYRKNPRQSHSASSVWVFTLEWWMRRA